MDKQQQGVSANGKYILTTTVNGRMESIIEYDSFAKRKDGQAVYYLDEVIQSTVNWDDETKVGSEVLYRDGIIHMYICHDSYGDTVFYRKYKGRNIVGQRGSIYPHGLGSTDSLAYWSYHFTAFVPRPPYCKVSTKCFLLKLQTGDTVFPVHHVMNYGWIEEWNFLGLTSGKYKQIFMSVMTDSLRSTDRQVRTVDSSFFQR